MKRRDFITLLGLAQRYFKCSPLTVCYGHRSEIIPG
jgi:hypothetical protein